MRTLLALAVLSALLLTGNLGHAAQPPGGASLEPNYQSASQWWTELTKKWTPVGWRNHLFRYNVLFNGAVVAEPRLNRRTARTSIQTMAISARTGRSLTAAVRAVPLGKPGTRAS